MKCKNCKAEIKTSQKFCPKCGTEIKTKKKLSKKAQAFIAGACCLALIVSGTMGGLYFYNNKNVTTTSDDNYIVLDAGFTDILITDEQSAIEAVDSVSDILGIDNAENELQVSSVNTIDGDTFYRLQQYYNDIPVYGKSINMAVDTDGQALGLTSNYYILETNLDTELKASQADIEKSLKKHFDNQDIVLEEIDNSKLVYYVTENNKITLAYELFNTVPGYIVFIDANSGRFLIEEPRFSANNVICDSDYGSITCYKDTDNKYVLGDEEKKIFILNGHEQNCLYQENGKASANPIKNVATF